MRTVVRRRGGGGVRSGIVLVILTVGLLLFLHLARPAGFGEIDLLQYWAAARLFWSGQNPYDHTLLLAVQRTVAPTADLPVIMWNPPPILTLISPIGFLPFAWTVTLWFFLSAVAIIAAAVMLANLLKLPSGKGLRRLGIVGFVCTFYPILLCFYYGQISTFLLFVLSLSLGAMQRDGGIHRSFKGGLFLAGTLVKPHLLYLLYLFLGVQALRRRRWSTIQGLLLGGAVLALPPLLMQPGIYGAYWEAMKAPPIYWRTPTLGNWLQAGTGISTMFVRSLPTYLTAFLVLTWTMVGPRPRYGVAALFGLVPLSLVTSPYGWVYDQVLLLPPILWMISQALVHFDEGNVRPIGYLSAALLQMNVIFYLTPGELGQDIYVWVPLVVMVGAFIFRNLKRHRVAPTELDSSPGEVPR